MSGPLAHHDEKDVFVVFFIRCSVIFKGVTMSGAFTRHDETQESFVVAVSAAF